MQAFKVAAYSGLVMMAAVLVQNAEARVPATSQPTSCPSQPAEQDPLRSPLSLTIGVSKPCFRLGEDIELTTKLKNTSAAEVTVPVCRPVMEYEAILVPLRGASTRPSSQKHSETSFSMGAKTLAPGASLAATVRVQDWVEPATAGVYVVLVVWDPLGFSAVVVSNPITIVVSTPDKEGRTCIEPAVGDTP